MRRCAASQRSSRESIRVSPIDAGVALLCIFFFVTAAFGILQNYSPAILGNVYGMSLVVATGSLTAYLLGSAAGTITGGFLASRNERNDRLIAIALGFSAHNGAATGIGTDRRGSGFPDDGVDGFRCRVRRDRIAICWSGARQPVQFGKAAFGRIYGFVYSGLDVGLAMSPLVFGPLLDAGKFQAALVAVAMLQVAALLTAMRIGAAARSRAVAA